MSVSGRHRLVDPLLTFGDALGEAQPDWTQKEQLNQLTHYDTNFSRGVAATLTLAQLKPLAEAYGDALVCRFSLGDLVALDVTPSLDQEALDAFHEETKLTPTLKFEL